MLFVDNSKFNMTLLENVVIVIIDESILFANGKSNTCLRMLFMCSSI